MTVNNFTVRAYAKLNLTLEITGVRDDGYHLIESFMTPVSIFDELQITPSGDFSLNCDDASVPVDSRNTIVKAWSLFSNRFKPHCGFSVKLRKRIPHGAGMGGGSADAAAFLRFACDYFKIDPKSAEISDLALKVGCDVPFCLRNSTATASGLGQILKEAPKLPEGLFCVVAKPADGASTQDVYRQYDRHPAPYTNSTMLFAQTAEKEPAVIDTMLYNSLEKPARAVCPAIAKVLSSLGDHFSHPSMTGSGSACFALTFDLDQAEYACSILSKEFPFTAVASVG